MSRLILSWLVFCSCGSVSPLKADAQIGVGDGGTDTGTVDATAPACDVTKSFMAPVTVGGINTTVVETNAWLSGDQLTIYFTRVPINNSDNNIFRATRLQSSGPFTGVVPLTGINTTGSEDRAVLSGDGLSLYVETSGADVSISTRTSLAAEFVGLSPVSGLSSSNLELTHWISSDGLTAYFGSEIVAADYDIYRATRPNTSTGFGTRMAVAEINAAIPNLPDEYSPVLSEDGLEIFFMSERGMTNSMDIYHALRTTTTGSFGTPTPVSEINVGAENEWPTWLSADRCQIVFSSNRAGGDGGNYDIWMATRPK